MKSNGFWIGNVEKPKRGGCRKRSKMMMMMMMSVSRRRKIRRGGRERDVHLKENKELRILGRNIPNLDNLGHATALQGTGRRP